MRNKKGTLLPGEMIVKVILSIFGLAILISLLVLLFSLIQKRDAKNEAISSLNYMLERISVAKQSGMTEATILVPKNWFIISYQNKNDITECKDKCLCICPDEGWFFTRIACENDKGICKEIDYSVSVAEEGIGIEKGIDLILTYDGTKTSIRKK